MQVEIDGRSFQANDPDHLRLAVYTKILEDQNMKPACLDDQLKLINEMFHCSFSLEQLMTFSGLNNFSEDFEREHNMMEEMIHGRFEMPN